MDRLSSGKLVSERIIELLDEVKQRDLVAAEIILGSKAIQLLLSERKPKIFYCTDDYDPRARLPISLDEAAEYVGIDTHI